METEIEVENWDNEYVKEILWILKETEDVIDDQLSTEKRKSVKGKVKWIKTWSERNSSQEKSNESLKEKLEKIKLSILSKILILVKKRLGYDIDYSNSVFSDIFSDPQAKLVYEDVAKLSNAVKLPKQMSEYIHLVIFSMISLKYLSDLEYIYRVNRGTVFRDRDFKKNKFLYLRFRLHRYILNFALMSFHPLMIRFNKLRITMKNIIDMKFYFINMKIEDYISETKCIWKRPSTNPKKLDQADQDELKTFYDECRSYLQENCFVWLENFKVDVSGELCHDEFLDGGEEADILTFVTPGVQDTSSEDAVGSAIAGTLEEVTIILDEDNYIPRQTTEDPTPEVVRPLFANPQEAADVTRGWRILQSPNAHTQGGFDTMSQTNSSISEVFSDELPSNSQEVASNSGSDSTYSGSANSSDLSYHRARKMPRLY